MNFADPLNLPTECLSEKSKKETKKISKNVLDEIYKIILLSQINIKDDFIRTMRKILVIIKYQHLKKISLSVVDIGGLKEENVLGFFLLDKKKEKIMKFYLNEIKSLAQHQNI